MKESPSLRLGIIIGINPGCNKHNFSNFYLFMFAQPPHEESPTTAMTNEDGSRADIISFEFSFPNFIIRLKRQWHFRRLSEYILPLQLLLEPSDPVSITLCRKVWVIIFIFVGSTV